MGHPVFVIDWSHRRVAWIVRRPADELSAALALEAAAERLRRSDARVEADPAGGALRFRSGSRTTRSWLACVSDGRVEVEQGGDEVSVKVGAGLRPLLRHVVVAALIGALLGPFWSLRLAAFIGMANYLYAHFGLLRVAEAVQYAAPAKQAA